MFQREVCLLGPSYFLIAVSTRENLNLCKKYGLAGLTSSVNGAWTYSDISMGSMISFLYGARVHNLYEVVEKFCVKDSENPWPWRQMTLRSGRTYTFPFRLRLRPLRDFGESGEPLTRREFGYVAENLLLRGGYRKTHFQAATTDLHYASEVGRPSQTGTEEIKQLPPRFQVKFTLDRTKSQPPEVFGLRETILQAAIRNYLSDETRLTKFLELVGVDSVKARELEALGEKALPQGYIDILLKEANPTGSSLKLLVEVKLGKASTKDLHQLRSYLQEFEGDSLGGILVAREFGKLVEDGGIKFIQYSFDMFNDPLTFDDLVASLHLQRYQLERGISLE